MTWSQDYDPLRAWYFSTLVSAVPVVTLFFVLVVLRARVWVAALAGSLMAVVIALIVFGMPAPLVAAAGCLGVIFGLLRIAWVIVASIFLYNVAVETGQFQVMKESIAALSSDMRLQAVLIAFCFGAFLEGTGGGGAPVAVAGSFLIGLGFPHFQAAPVCLLANTAPVAWGAPGRPAPPPLRRPELSRARPAQPRDPRPAGGDGSHSGHGPHGRQRRRPPRHRRVRGRVPVRAVPRDVDAARVRDPGPDVPPA